jgi:hypothetical protein
MTKSDKRNSKRKGRRKRCECEKSLKSHESCVVLALDAFVEDGLTFIGGTQLHGVEVHLAVRALGAFLLHLQSWKGMCQINSNHVEKQH